ncbi:hypothetical protein [Pseudolysinimonas sp.]|uniref:hypothetical protein n=1 Tax=Pseudolysinimonas sp. TaxID=2680009 RepID=UPI003F81B005
MASNFSCIGLPIGDEQELLSTVRQMKSLAHPMGHVEGVDVFRWEDSSGARVIMGFRGDELEDLLPSFAGDPGIRLSNCRPLNADVVAATVVDSDGEQTTSIAFELEQRRALRRRNRWSGLASVSGFAPSAQFFASEKDFDESPASLVDPSADPDQPPPPHVIERGIRWPYRMATESFMSLAVFGEPEAATADARLNGFVRVSEVRHNSLTGRPFAVSRISCLGFEIDLLTDLAENSVPAPGSIFAGWVFLAASIDAFTIRRRNWIAKAFTRPFRSA